MSNPNAELMSSRDITVRPYHERSTHSLLYIKAALEQQGVLVPTDLLAVLGSRGVIV